MNSVVRLGVVGLLAGLAATGCGSAVKLYPVEGKVTFPDGKPLTGGVVEFSSEADTTKGLNARGEIGEDGTFRLKTWIDGVEREGAVEGSHRALVVPPPYESGNMSGSRPRPPIHPRFKTYDKSGLTFTVAPGPNTVPIRVEAP